MASVLVRAGKYSDIFGNIGRYLERLFCVIRKCSKPFEIFGSEWARNCILEIKQAQPQNRLTRYRELYGRARAHTQTYACAHTHDGSETNRRDKQSTALVANESRQAVRK